MPFQTLTLSPQMRQQQIMAPQMRQSLELLQLPIMELKGVIRQEMERNPTIEDVFSAQEVSANTSTGEAETIMGISSRAVEDFRSGRQEEAAAVRDNLAPGEKNPYSGDLNAVPKEADVQGNHLDFEKDTMAPLDQAEREYLYDSEKEQVQPYTKEDEERRRFMFDSLSQPVSLQQHLLDQLGVSDLSGDDRALGETIIGSLDDDGFLPYSAEELADQTSFPAGRVERVLSAIQDFDPPGIAARNLRECLLIQIREHDEPEADLAEAIIDRHLEDLARHRMDAIAKALGCSAEDVERAAKLIRTLNPTPGAEYTARPTDYITPEVFVEKDKNGRWHVVVDDELLPHIQLNREYVKMASTPGTKREIRTYINEQLRSGRFLMESIARRQKTIYDIASAIVDAQQDFLNHGVSRLRPMTMAEVAEKTGVHETTVSRAVANKYMKTPNGVYELKYFFSHGLATADGGTMSNKTIQDKIAAMVRDEPPDNPLSDQAIVDQLKKDGIEIARRTVAKYRGVLKIPSSSARKR